MKKHILLLAVSMAVVAVGLAHPSFAEEQKAIDFTPKRPMTIERHDYQGEAIKAQQADDMHNVAKRNATDAQSLQHLLHQDEFGGLSFPNNQLPPKNDGAPRQPDAGKTAAKPAN